MDTYLFVITRDLVADPSAAHLVRVAVATGLRRHDVTIFLAESAICRESREACQAALERLRCAGANLLAHVDLLRTTGLTATEMALSEADDRSLATLLLTPGIRAHWC